MICVQVCHSDRAAGREVICNIGVTACKRRDMLTSASRLECWKHPTREYLQCGVDVYNTRGCTSTGIPPSSHNIGRKSLELRGVSFRGLD